MTSKEREQSEDLPAYPVQLADAYLYEARATRGEATTGDPDEPTLEATVNLPLLADDRRSFNQVVGVKILAPQPRGGWTLEIECSVNGRFQAASELSEKYVQEFGDRESLVLLWPYVRAFASELVRMTQVKVPPLPTLDVSSILGLSPTAITRAPTPKKKAATTRKAATTKVRTASRPSPKSTPERLR